MRGQKKEGIISFKVDEKLALAMQEMPNRSEFIRSAILSALKSTCPLCNGSGTLTQEQLKHWYAFSDSHSVERCGECHEFYLVCSARKNSKKSRAH